MQQNLSAYKTAVSAELKNILDYWRRHTVDHEHGGFYGQLDNDNNVQAQASKGAVLNCRILWAFSAAYNAINNEAYLVIAHRAYQYIINHFIDKEHGGVYWTVDYKGNPSDTKKQIYALSFAVYGLSEYYRCSGVEDARQQAIDLYRTIVKYSHDEKGGGYIEAFAQDWTETGDLRLSDKDANERKTMNTHLHVLEGFANLYRVWPDAGLKQRIEELIHLFLDHIVDPETSHLLLFFDDEWNSKSATVSYGHDIEAAWLIEEAAEIISDKSLLDLVRQYSVRTAGAASKGLDSDGGIWYEYEPASNHLIKEKHWWPQAEAMVGFFNVWQTTHDAVYLQQSVNSWRFIQNHIINKDSGEWYWGIDNNYTVMQGKDKVGIWKCPYHSVRACLQIMERIDKCGADKMVDTIKN